MGVLFLQTAGNGKDEVHKKCSYEGLNFVCSNLPDGMQCWIYLPPMKNKKSTKPFFY